MEESKKVIIPNAVVVLFMIILLLFIILPPVFRVLFPVEINQKVIEEYDVKVLNCMKTGYDYKLVASSMYLNNNIKNTKLTYTKINNNTYSNVIFQNEINYLDKLNNIEKSVKSNEYKYIIDRNLINNNELESNLSNYLNTIENEKLFFEQAGYTCTLINS